MDIVLKNKLIITHISEILMMCFIKQHHEMCTYYIEIIPSHLNNEVNDISFFLLKIINTFQSRWPSSLMRKEN